MQCALQNGMPDSLRMGNTRSDNIPIYDRTVVTQECGPRRYVVTEAGRMFVKKSKEPTSDKITSIKRKAGTLIASTGRLWMGPHGGVWAEVEMGPSKAATWALVFGPGFGLNGPALIEDDRGWPTHPKDNSEWQVLLSPSRYQVLREKETEPVGSGEYDKFYPAIGHFCCAGCNVELYSASSKFNSHCGWPAFSKCYTDLVGRPRVVAQCDWAAGGREVLCRRCGGHLGHVFMDGPNTGGDTAERHCVNSLAIIYSERPFFAQEALADYSTFREQLKNHHQTGDYDTVS